MSTGIYKITNKINNKSYIGQSVHIEIRWREHIRKGNLIHKAIKKYGVNNFTFEILEECKINELNEKEEYYIKKYNTIIPNGYNIEEFSNGFKTSYSFYDKDAFLKIVKEIKDSDLLFQEIAENNELSIRTIIRINQGETHYIEDEDYPLRKRQINTCIDCGAKISSKAIRCSSCSMKVNLEERPEKMELAKDIIETGFEAVGRKYNVSGNSIKGWCKTYNIPHLKKELKNWYYEKMGIQKNDELNNPKKVLQIDKKNKKIIAEYNSTAKAASKTGIDHIKEVCDGKRLSAGGYFWEYKEVE